MLGSKVLVRNHHYDDLFRCVDANSLVHRIKPGQQGCKSQVELSALAGMTAWRAVDWSRGLVDQNRPAKSRRPQTRGLHHKAPHASTGSAAPRPVGRLSHRPGRRFTCSFLSGVASRTMTKFVRALAVPKKCCAAAGQPQTAPWTRLRRGAPPRHPRGCRRGTRCRRVRPLC